MAEELFYPIPFIIPDDSKIVFVIMQKIDCGNGCSCYSDDEDICNYCNSGHYRYNQMMMTISSSSDSSPLTCMIIRNGTTSISKPQNGQEYVISKMHRNDVGYVYTIAVETFDFTLSDSTDIDIFRPYIDLFVNITGCLTDIRRMKADIRLKKMIDINMQIRIIEKMTMANCIAIMQCDTSLHKWIQPISHIIASAIIHSYIKI